MEAESTASTTMSKYAGTPVARTLDAEFGVNDSGLEQTPAPPAAFAQNQQGDQGNDGVPPPPARRFSGFRRSSSEFVSEEPKSPAAVEENEATAAAPKTPPTAASAQQGAITTTVARDMVSAEQARRRIEVLLHETLLDHNSAVVELGALAHTLQETRQKLHEVQAGDTSNDTQEAREQMRSTLVEIKSKLLRARQTRLTELKKIASHLSLARSENQHVQGQIAVVQHRLGSINVVDASATSMHTPQREGSSISSMILEIRQVVTRAYDVAQIATLAGVDSPMESQGPTSSSDPTEIESLMGTIRLMLLSRDETSESTSDEKASVQDLLKAIGAYENELKMLDSVEGLIESQLKGLLASIQAETTVLKVKLSDLLVEIRSTNENSRLQESQRMEDLLIHLEQDLDNRLTRERQLQQELSHLKDENLSLLTSSGNQNQTQQADGTTSLQGDNAINTSQASVDISGLEETLSTVTRLKDRTDEENNELATKLHELQLAQASHDQKLQNETRLRQQAEAQIQVLEERVSARSDLNSSTSAELYSSEQKRQELERDILEKDLEIGRLRETIKLLENGASESNNTISRKLQNRVDELTKELEKLEEALDEKITELDRSVNVASNLESEITHQKAKLAGESSRNDTLGEKNRTLQLEKMNAEDKMVEKARELKECQDRLSESDTINQYMRQKLEDYGRQLQDLESSRRPPINQTAGVQPNDHSVKLRQLLGEKEQLSMLLAQAKANFESAMEQYDLDREAMKAELEYATERVQKLDDRVAEMTASMHKLQSEKDIAVELAASQKSMAEQFKNSLEMALEERVNAVNDAVSTAGAPTAQVVAQLDRARYELQAAHGQIHQLEDELDRTRHMNPVVVGDQGPSPEESSVVAALRGEIEAVQAELRAEKANHDITQHQLAYLKQRQENDVELLRNHAQIESERLVDANNQLKSELMKKESLANRSAVVELGFLKAENEQLLQALQNKGDPRKTPRRAPPQFVRSQEQDLEYAYQGQQPRSIRPPVPNVSPKRSAGSKNAKRPKVKPQSYEISVWSTEAADRIGVSGRKLVIRVGTDTVTLLDAKKKKTLHTWPIEHVLRYGVDEDTVSLEIGRINTTGPGVYYFNCPAADDLFNALDIRCSR